MLRDQRQQPAAVIRIGRVGVVGSPILDRRRRRLRGTRGGQPGTRNPHLFLGDGHGAAPSTPATLSTPSTLTPPTSNHPTASVNGCVVAVQKGGGSGGSRSQPTAWIEPEGGPLIPQVYNVVPGRVYRTADKDRAVIQLPNFVKPGNGFLETPLTCSDWTSH